MLLMHGWISILLGVFMASGCCGQAPILTLYKFSSGCPSHNLDNVRVEGTVDMNGADPLKYTAVDLVDSTGDPIAGKTFASCSTAKPFSCKQINSSFFEVAYEALANQQLSEDNVRLRSIDDVTDVPTPSGSVPYPVVKDKIGKVLKVNGSIVPVPSGDDEVTHVATGTVTVSYDISGVNDPAIVNVSILDSSSGMLFESPNSLTVSGVIDTAQHPCIFVSFDTTTGCSGKTKVCFNEQTTTTNSPNTTTSGQDDSDDSGLKWWEILLIIVGSAASFGLVGFIVYVCIVKKKLAADKGHELETTPSKEAGDGDAPDRSLSNNTDTTSKQEKRRKKIKALGAPAVLPPIITRTETDKVRRMKKKNKNQHNSEDTETDNTSTVNVTNGRHSPGRPFNDTRIHPEDGEELMFSTSQTSTLPLTSNFQGGGPRDLPPLKNSPRPLP